MSRQFTQTTVMNDWHRITQENKVRKYTRVTLDQYDGEWDSQRFFILTHSIEYSDQPVDQPPLSDAINEYVIRDGKEAVIRAVNLWNSVVMEKDFGHITADDDSGVPF